MNAQTYERLCELFATARDLAEGPRSELISRIEVEEPDLARSLRLMLDHDDPGFLSTPAMGTNFLSEMRWASEPTPLPERVGTYEILERIGEGGVGIVYRARQTHPVPRDVALKVLRPGADTARVLTRFEHEWAVLARLQHPHIATMFDAGVALDGRPYIAMEYLAGEHLTEYCESRGLSVAARIQLMMQICDAVQHAHRRAVLHRDLKPTNVLVIDGPQGPVAKVIDFGVAKMLAAAPGLSRQQTEHGLFVGTLVYMSPEQLSADPSEIDVRSDVYALGVMLYELLAGRLPWDLDRAVLAEAARAVLHESLPVMRRDGRRLPEDLQAIVWKAMARERDRRYPSVEELRQDLARYLQTRPVTARRPSPAYRVRRFVQRNRAVSILAVLLVAGGILMTARLAASERALRRRNEATLTSTNIILRQVIADLETRSGTTGVRREALAALMGPIESLAKQAPDHAAIQATRAEALHRMSNLEYDLRDYNESMRLRHEALLIREALHKANPEDRDATRALALALVVVGDLHKSRGETEQALRLYERADGHFRTLATDRPNDATALDDLCWSLERVAALTVDPVRALRLSEERLRVATRVCEIDPANPQRTHNLAVAHLHLAYEAERVLDYESMGRHSASAWTTTQQATTAMPENRIYLAGELAAARMRVRWLLVERGASEAESLLDQALPRALQAAKDNPNHHQIGWSAMRLLQLRGEVATLQDDAATAYTALTEAVAMAEHLLAESPNDPTRLSALGLNLTLQIAAAASLGQEDEARRHHARGLELLRPHLLGTLHSEATVLSPFIALCLDPPYADLARPDEALRVAEDAVALADLPDHRLYRILAWVRARTGDKSGAHAAVRAALQTAKGHPGMRIEVLEGDLEALVEQALELPPLQRQ